jgi:hypothetical protein
MNPPESTQDFPYLVALMDGELKLKIACEDADSIQAAVAELCRQIGWNPLDHYRDDFWSRIRATEVYDAGEFAWINFYESELIADMVVGAREKIEELPQHWAAAMAQDGATNG